MAVQLSEDRGDELLMQWMGDYLEETVQDLIKAQKKSADAFHKQEDVRWKAHKAAQKK